MKKCDCVNDSVSENKLAIFGRVATVSSARQLVSVALSLESIISHMVVQNGIKKYPVMMSMVALVVFGMTLKIGERV